MELRRVALLLLAPLATVAQYYPSGANMGQPGGYFPASGSAYTYYVSLTGSDAASGLTPATAWQTIAKVNGTTLTPGQSVGFQRGGTWAEQLAPGQSGTASSPITFGVYGVGAWPRITGGTRSLSVATRTWLVFDHLRFSSKGVLTTNGSDLTFKYCVFDGAVSYSGLQSSGTTRITATNNVFANNDQYGMWLNTGTHILRNNIFLGNGLESDATNGDYYAIRSTATVDSDYNLWTGNSSRPRFNVSNVAFSLGSHELIQVNPLFASLRTSSGMMTISADDYDTAYFLAMAGAVNPLGVHASFFVGPALGLGSTEWANLATLVAAGNEIGVHSYTHSSLITNQLFTVSTTNASPSINIDHSGTWAITLSTTTPGNTVSLPIYLGANSIYDLQQAIIGKGWTVTIPSTLPNLVFPQVFLASCKDTGGAQTTFPYTVQPDVSSPNYWYWDQEIRQMRDLISTQLSYTPTTISTPSGEGNAALQAYVHTLGLQAMRSAQAVGDPGVFRLNNLNLYDLAAFNMSDFLALGTTESVVRSQARGLALYVNSGPIGYNIYTHNSTEFTAAELGWFVSEALASGVTFKTIGQLASDVRVDHASSNGMTFTKTYTDLFDFTLQSGSPAVGAGVYIPGVSTANPPSIGAK